MTNALKNIVRNIRYRDLISWSKMAIPPEQASDLAPKFDHDLGRIYFANQGPIVHKWTHYLDVYQHHFSRYRETSVKMLEIGVSNGGSLNMWRKYFGDGATIFGIDINPECAKRVTPPNQVRIGSQNDPAFLKRVVEEMGTPDIVLDDGSHVATHQKTSFDTLFPLLNEGGLYVIEDMHTSYWRREFEGGYRKRGTAIEQVKNMIDDMHAWYHRQRPTTPARDWIWGIHVYDSITVIEKKKINMPGHIRIGSE